MLAREPVALAIELARQWSTQIAGAPELYTSSGTPDPFPLRPLGVNLKNSLPAGSPVVLVLDTLEELLIAHKAALVGLLRQLEKLSENCPPLTLILAGRYDLRERLADDYGATGAAIDQQVRPFDDVEARDYLVRLRRTFLR